MTNKNYEELLAVPDSELETFFMPPKTALNEDGRMQGLERMILKSSSV